MRIDVKVAGKNVRVAGLLCITLLAGAGLVARPLRAQVPGPRIEVSFSSSVRPAPLTGRILVVFAHDSGREPRLQIGWPGDAPPVFGIDVSGLRPGAAAVFDSRSPGVPMASLNDLPEGDYYVQALANVYTEFHRSDGHVIWAHMDQWEGQRAQASPGNLYNEPQRVHLAPRSGFELKLQLTQVIPPIQVPPDTQWVKHIKFESKLLSQFWGHPMYIGATVLLPKGYDEHPGVRYPVVFQQNHFDLSAPFGFRTNVHGEGRRANDPRGYDFYQAWNSPDFPRVIAVTFQHPTPYYDDSYAVNSANNGPYGDALMTEVIPYIEQHFRVIRAGYARVLTGGSTGGWESLALQAYHPEFFGGTWTFCPDPIDFRRDQLINAYDDENAFYEPGHQWTHPLRPLQRRPNGQPEISVQDFSHYEAVLGSHGRSGEQLAAWEAAYGPVGEDGYPKPLWDKSTGVIDHSVAIYMRDHGYDLRYYIETNWPRIGPQLVGKLHLYTGDMDSFYLNLAVYLLEDFLKGTTAPYYAGSFEYGRPMKAHGWMPMSYPELVRIMADEVARHSPPGDEVRSWHY